MRFHTFGIPTQLKCASPEASLNGGSPKTSATSTAIYHTHNTTGANLMLVVFAMQTTTRVNLQSWTKFEAVPWTYLQGYRTIASSLSLVKLSSLFSEPINPFIISWHQKCHPGHLNQDFLNYWTQAFPNPACHPAAGTIRGDLSINYCNVLLSAAVFGEAPSDGPECSTTSGQGRHTGLG